MNEKVIHPDLERLAELAHEQWSGWMKYQFDCGEEIVLPNGEITYTIPFWAVERWKRQMGTPYSDLPEEEKKSDRIEAQKVIDLLNIGQ